MLLDVEHNVAEHLDQAAIGVVREPRIVAALGQRFHALVVQAEIQNRIHHAGHGELRARAHADQQRILALAQFLSLQVFELLERRFHLAVDFLRHAVVPHVLATGLGLDREARRHRQPGIGHLGQAGAFAAEHVLHLAVAVGFAAAKGIHILGCSSSGWFLISMFSFGESLSSPS